MSMEFTALAMAVGPQVRSERLLMLALCDRADENGVCWPSRADLRERASMSDATLTRCLRRLEAAGWIQRQRRFNTSNVFRVNVLRLRELHAARAVRPRFVVDFAPFPEEAAAMAEAVENKGSAHGECFSAHGDALSAHFAAPNQSLTDHEPKARKAISGRSAPVAPARPVQKRGKASGAGPAHPFPSVRLCDLSPFARSCLDAGKPVPIGAGLSIAVGSPGYRALEAEALLQRHGG